MTGDKNWQLREGDPFAPDTAALQARIAELERNITEANAREANDYSELLDDRNQLKVANVRMVNRLAELEAMVAAQAGQEPIAYGDRLGTHLQSVYAIPSTGVPAWMGKLTPLYLSTPVPDSTDNAAKLELVKAALEARRMSVVRQRKHFPVTAMGIGC